MNVFKTRAIGQNRTEPAKSTTTAKKLSFFFVKDSLSTTFPYLNSKYCASEIKMSYADYSVTVLWRMFTLNVYQRTWLICTRLKECLDFLNIRINSKNKGPESVRTIGFFVLSRRSRNLLNNMRSMNRLESTLQIGFCARICQVKSCFVSTI